MNTKAQRFILTTILLIAMLVGSFWNPRQTFAGTILVDTTADELDGSSGNGLCSLREAITNANLNNGDQVDCEPGTGDDIITLGAFTYTLTRAAIEDNNQGGDLDVMGTLTINGVSYKNTIIQAGTTSPVNDDCSDCVDRVFDILSSAQVEINNLAVRYGRSPDGVAGSYSGAGSPGGGIRNKGNLTLSGCSVLYNRTGNGVYDAALTRGGNGGTGGGIQNEGTLILENSMVINNKTGNGGSSPIDSGADAGSGGTGGGILVYPGKVMTATNTTISNNTTGMGAAGSDANSADAGNGGDGGRGGGVANYGFTTLLASQVHGNTTGTGAVGGDVLSGTGIGGDGGNGGDGAGIYQEEFSTSLLILDETTVSQNVTGNPARGGSGSTNGANGVGGDGGGLHIYVGPVIVRGSTFQDNEAVYGGGISITNAGVMTVTNSTVSGNTASQSGGGIYNTVTGVTLSYVTVTGNTAELGEGGGIASTSNITLISTILATNSDDGLEHPDCYGKFVSGDYNLVGISDSPDCDFTSQANDLLGIAASPENPDLGTLMDNGGPTWTHALLETSPAVNLIPYGVNGCMTEFPSDQRGIPRSIYCDIGAYELEGLTVYLPLVMK